MKKILSIIFFISWTINSYAGPVVINNYETQITVNQNASLTISEIITITTDGVIIRHGIFRELPTQYKTLQGYDVDIGFKVHKVLRDGSPEPYHIEARSNGVRIYIGDAHKHLSPGTYTYNITYSVNKVLGFFNTHDELYWNATGNAWVFPIEHASAILTLPKQIHINHATAYTGVSGATDKNYKILYSQPNKVEFTTTTPLPANNGLTIVAGWPKGVIKAPDLTMKIDDFLNDNQSLAIALTGYIVLIFYYMLAWFYLGRDPRNKVVIPLYEPPEQFTPQALGYIKEMGYNHKLFTAAIINMAVKNYLTIVEKDKDVFVLKKISTDDSILTPPEQAISNELFRKLPSIALQQDNHRQISEAISNFKDALKKEFCNKYFILNTPIIILGIIISLVSLIPMISEQVELFTPTLFIGAYVYFFVHAGLTSFINKHKNHVLSATSFILLTVLIVLIVIQLFPTYVQINNHLMYLILFLFLTTDSIFADLMKKPTPLGVDIIIKTRGFELFLQATDEDQMNFRNPPDKTPSLFERYLPFALALGLEQKWSNQFSQILMESQYNPSWYSSSNYHRFSPKNFSYSVGSSLNSAISSSSVAPGSSSGFSSGGSSGGGGGGGGGGGW